MKNTSAIWFFESHDNKFYAIDSVNYMKDALIYGVTFVLQAEIHKTDAQLLKELQKNFPGHYEYVDQYGSQYYINRRGCITIILKREWHFEKPYPSVSFCYGLSKNQGAYYGHKTGNKSGFD
ncbi:hypothetical protein [Dyadobacter sp. CY347]|uniref:hypothetical protein n=1 Tax=Dyadobacter sp. CY347 TaxID=2909336 RepID=UPI001F178D47|nr:hypothetical protein [Dyadobacter sp. CY347]MCF2489703.1 hypothetical protein [Dyadobacter sp. CY347]